MRLGGGGLVSFILQGLVLEHEHPYILTAQHPIGREIIIDYECRVLAS